jgi:peptide/nickel transport system substrate-binding protein
MLRWTRRRTLATIAMALSVNLGGMAATDAAAESVLRVIPHADLKNLDPI